jgi:predicted nuclease of restriction endonuclease-like RecB superfamily
VKPITPKNKMNGTEARMARDLELRKRAGDILDYQFEAVKLRLSDNTFYTPDFFITHADHFEVLEVKGFWRDDARVKIKVAAQMYPYFKFTAVQWKKKQWVYERIN